MSWFSVASRIRNPWLAPALCIAWTWATTFRSLYPFPELLVAAVPVVAGWLVQVTRFSVQLPARRVAWRVRPAVVESE